MNITIKPIEDKKVTCVSMFIPWEQPEKLADVVKVLSDCFKQDFASTVVDEVKF